MRLVGFLGLLFPRTADAPNINEPASIVIICLISDLAVVGSYSASFLKLLVFLVLVAFAFAFVFPWFVWFRPSSSRGLLVLLGRH